MSTKGIICVTNFFSLFPVRAAEAVAKSFLLSLLANNYYVAILVPNFDRREYKELLRLQSLYENRLYIYSVTNFEKDRIDNSLFLRIMVSLFWYGFIMIKGLALRNNNYECIVSLYHPTHFASLSAHIISRIRRMFHIIWVRDLFPSTSKEQSRLELLPYTIVMQFASIGLVRADLSLYVSEEIRQAANKKYLLKGQSSVLPTMIDTSERLTLKPSITFQRDDKTIILAFLGELYPIRIPGLILLLKAIRHLLKENYQVKLMMIGHGYSMSKFLDKVKELQLENNVILIGKISNELVPHYLMKADIGIGALNNDSDTVGNLPVKILEYMVASLPIINASSCVPSNVIEDKFNGILIPADDYIAVAEAIKLLINDPHLRGQLGKNARKFAEEHYSIESVTKKFESFVADVRNNTG